MKRRRQEHRIHRARGGRDRTIVHHCIECPDLPECIVVNDRPASGPVPDECPLRKGYKRDA